MDDDSKVSLRHYIEALFEQYKELHAKEHALNSEAVSKAYLGMEKRLEAMNELRAQILEERGGLATKEWVLTIEKALRGALEDHKALSISERTEAAKIRTLATRTLIGAAITALISITFGILSFVIK